MVEVSPICVLAATQRVTYLPCPLGAGGASVAGMVLNYVKPELIPLKSSADFNEAWLQERIAEDTSILGLGDLDLLARERTQGKAGRLDLLLSDPEENRRYEVELMLGATDPSHVIRTIEYWDIERRRYPAYDHVAVLVAEDITSRFLNVLSLFAGSIPLIAIQLNALKVGNQIVLDFVRVLDQTELRTDDETPAGSSPSDRASWEARVGKAQLAIADWVLSCVNEKASRRQQLTYNKQFIGLNDGARSNNFVMFAPRKKHVRAGMTLSDAPSWLGRFDDAGVPGNLAWNDRRLWIDLTEPRRAENEALIRQAVHQAVAEFEE